MQMRCLARDGVGEQARRGLRAEQFGRRQQARQAVVELVGAAHAARGEQARQQRVHAGLPPAPRRRAAARRAGSGSVGLRRDHSASSTGATAGARRPRVRRAHRRLRRRLEALRVALAAQRQRGRLAALGALQQGRERPGVERAPGLGPGGPVFGQRAARASAVVDLQVRRGGLGWRTPQPLSQNEFTASAPRASRASLIGSW